MSAASNVRSNGAARVALATLVATIAIAGVACGSDDERRRHGHRRSLRRA